MRKLKNLELVGKTRLIPGVGHVTFEEDVPEHVAVACDAAGLDWCGPSPLAGMPYHPNGGIDGGDALRSLDKLGTGGAQGDVGGEDGNAGDASDGTPAATLINQDGKDTNNGGEGNRSVTRKRK